MKPYSKTEAFEYLKENDVRFVRLSFCDIFGQLKNITIPPDRVEEAFSSGIRFDASQIRGFLNREESDLLLFPDPTTLENLPWRHSEVGSVVRFYCDIKKPDLTPFEGDGRYLLKETLKRAKDEGLGIETGFEMEFYLFKLDDEGFPTFSPMDKAGYLDVAPMDKGENIRRSISVNLENMGICINSSHHEKGPGQNEISFPPFLPMDTADHIISFKAMVKTIANRNGLYASFLPKPLFNESGSGLHLLFNLKNASKEKEEMFTSGIISHIKEMQIFLNPIENSYSRLKENVPIKKINWGEENRNLLIRFLKSNNNDSNTIEIRLPDPSSNPYLVLSLLLQAGLDGIKNKKELKKEDNEELNKSLLEALLTAKDSTFIKKNIPEHLLNTFLNAKLSDWKEASLSKNREEYSRDMEFLVT